MRKTGVMSYHADPDRYTNMSYRRTGRSGLELPLISLGLWQNFGNDSPFDRHRAMLLRAFDLGITHFDLANNYGPPYGAAEVTAGRIFAKDLSAHRDEIVVSTKAGWDMWPGPYGSGGGGRKHLLASLNQSLGRLGLDYVDIFYSHRYDPNTPLTETAQALADAVHQGKALYVGISSYDATYSREMAELLCDLGVPLLIHQPSYSMFNRWIETDGLLEVASEQSFGVIGFSPLAQGLLTSRYLEGVPTDSRAGREGSFDRGWLGEHTLARLKQLNQIAARRGQTLSQLALVWALRDERVTSLLIGVSSVAQLEQNIAALNNLTLTPEELHEIDNILAKIKLKVDLWQDARNGTLGN